MEYSHVDSSLLRDLQQQADEIARERIADPVEERAKDERRQKGLDRARAEAFHDLYGPAFAAALKELVEQYH